jgi:hypothetical protein
LAVATNLAWNFSFQRAAHHHISRVNAIMDEPPPLSWDAGKKQINALGRSLGIKVNCACKWGAVCKKAHVLFALNRSQGVDDPRGKPCINLNLYGNDTKKTAWRDIVLRNLKIKEQPKNLHNVCVAPHHWSVSQLKYFETNNAKPSTTYLPKATMDSISHVTDERDSFRDEEGKKVYFQTPNVPESVWKQEAKSLVGSRNARVVQRTESAEKAEKSKKRKKRKAEIAVEKEEKRNKQRRDEMKNVWEWQEEIKALEREIETKDEMLQSKDDIIQSKDMELGAIKSRLDSARKDLELSKRKTSRAKAKSPVADVATGDSNSADQCKCSTDVLAMVSRLIIEWGGISRLTLTNSEWHKQHPEAAPILFGFEDWKETYLYIKCSFREIDIRLKGKIACDNAKDGKVIVVPQYLTDFERCLACKMFFQCMPHRGKVAAAFGVSDDVIGRAISEWGARWGKAGEQLSILIITRNYLKRECPDEYVAQGYPENAVLTDGKAFVTHYKRKDGMLQRFQQNSKVHNAAGLCLSWQTGAGLAFENTYMVGGRLTENSLVRLWGSLGKAEAPVSEWENFARTIEDKNGYFKLRLKCALDGVDYDSDSSQEVVEINDSGSSCSSDEDYEDHVREGAGGADDASSDDDTSHQLMGTWEADHDDWLSPQRPTTRNTGSSPGTPTTASPGGNVGERCRQRRVLRKRVRRQLRHSPHRVTPAARASSNGSCGSVSSDSDNSTTNNRRVHVEGAETTSAVGGLLDNVASDFEFRLRQMEKQQAAAGNKRKRSVLIDDKQALLDEAMDVLRSGPQSSALELLCQLEFHESLHKLYESGDLRKCMLSYYIKLMESDWMRILHYLGSDMVPEDYEPGDEPMPRVWQRLAKIPEEVDVIADKGFDKSSGCYPWWNYVWCPIILRDRNIKQTLPEEMVGRTGHRGIKRLRYTIETGYSRVTNQECLKDVIPYRNIPQLQNMLAWGHAMINLRMPFRRPGWSPPGYWDKATWSQHESRDYFV